MAGRHFLIAAPLPAAGFRIKMCFMRFAFHGFASTPVPILRRGRFADMERNTKLEKTMFFYSHPS
jgi:hypothetical protein